MKYLLNHPFLRTPLRIHSLEPTHYLNTPTFHALDSGNHSVVYVLPTDEALPDFLRMSIEPIPQDAFDTFEMYRRLSEMPQENLQFLLMQQAPSVVSTIMHIMGIVADGKDCLPFLTCFFLRSIKHLLRERRYER